ncbi:MAG: response regulator [Gammaproteobacteria bacterium]
MTLILIVEDEDKLARLEADYLRNAGFDTETISDGPAAVPWLKANAADLILLDLMLPGRDGLELCRDIRGFSGVPIIMVTARIEEIDRLLGLELGADDYICKPFSPREMVARVKAILRRINTPPTLSPPSLLRLEPQSFRIFCGEAEAELTAVEFQLLQTLHRQPGRIFSRSRLMDLIYSDRRIVADRTIDSHIKKLRRKLAQLLPDRELIHSVYGAGYRYDAEED